MRSDDIAIFADTLEEIGVILIESLNIIKREVDDQCPAVLPFRFVALHLPECFWDALFATELRHSPVDWHSSRDGNKFRFPLRYPIFAAVTVWLRKSLFTKPFSAIFPILFDYSKDFL